MPDHEPSSMHDIEADLARRRADLADAIGELVHEVRERVDVRARARVAIARGRQRVDTAIEDDPLRAIGIAMLAAGVLSLWFLRQ
jgi:hypothetical protein